MTNKLLSDNRIGRLIEEALFEDIGLGDITSDSVVSEDLLGNAIVSAKEPGIIAGLDVLDLVYHFLDPQVTVEKEVCDGDMVHPGSILARVDGPAKSLLKGERVALNIMQRMSGIATATHRLVDAVKGTRAKIIDTRKTAPCMRVLDKMAVRMGGGGNHRFGLDDMVIIKDNHIAAAGGVRPALLKCVQTVRERDMHIRIEVETRTMEEVREAIACFDEGWIFQWLMLDNFPVDKMHDAVAFINRRVEVEASGNITLESVRAVAETGVDLISVGALTHSVHALDISLNMTLQS